MRRTRPMATLAIDTLGNRSRQEEFGRVGIGLGRRVSVVARKAFLVDLAPEIHVIRTVVAWVHGPEATLLRIPRDWEFDQLTARRLVEISAGVIARSQYVVDLLLNYVRFLSVG